MTIAIAILAALALLGLAAAGAARRRARRELALLEAEDEATVAVAVPPVAPELVELFERYVEAKRAIGEDAGALTAERFAARVERHARELEAKHGGRVRFEVIERGGQVDLRPIVEASR